LPPLIARAASCSSSVTLLEAVIAVPMYAFVGMDKLSLDGIAAAGAFGVAAALATDASEMPAAVVAVMVNV